MLPLMLASLAAGAPAPLPREKPPVVVTRLEAYHFRGTWKMEVGWGKEEWEIVFQPDGRFTQVRRHRMGRAIRRGSWGVVRGEDQNYLAVSYDVDGPQAELLSVIFERRKAGGYDANRLHGTVNVEQAFASTYSVWLTRR